MQASETPIACTLDSKTMGPRLAWIRGVTERSLLSHRLEGRTLRLVYRADAAEELRCIVELERVCCAFLDFALATTASEAVVTITAPLASDVDAQWLFDQFLPGEGAAASTCGCRGGCG